MAWYTLEPSTTAAAVGASSRARARTLFAGLCVRGRLQLDRNPQGSQVGYVYTVLMLLAENYIGGCRLAAMYSSRLQWHVRPHVRLVVQIAKSHRVEQPAAGSSHVTLVGSDSFGIVQLDTRFRLRSSYPRSKKADRLSLQCSLHGGCSSRCKVFNLANRSNDGLSSSGLLRASRVTLRLTQNLIHLTLEATS